MNRGDTGTRQKEQKGKNSFHVDKVKKNVREFLEGVENDILRISDMESTDCDDFMRSLNNKLEIVVDDDLFNRVSSSTFLKT